MTTEARIAFVLFFFAVWCFLGLIGWAIAAVIVRGRGALPALPLALAAACAASVSPSRCWAPVTSPGSS